MASRRDRAAIRQAQQRLADRTLLDDALAPYLRTDGREARVDDGIDLREEPAEAAGPTMVTLKVAAGATIDLLRTPARSTVVRVHRRPVAVLR